MKIKNFNQFNESWKTFIAGCLLLISSCDSINVKDKNGKSVPIKYDNNNLYTTTGVIKDITQIPMSNSVQYIFEIEDINGNTLNIEKYSMNPFPQDETSSLPFASKLKKGSKVKIVCGSDCKLYLVD